MAITPQRLQQHRAVADETSVLSRRIIFGVVPEEINE